MLQLKNKNKGKIWQLFRATDFESLMYPCFISSRILEIFPYTINASTIKICKLYSISNHYLHFYNYSIIEIKIFYDFNVSKTTTTSTSKKLDFYCYHILSNFITINTFILSGPRMCLFQNILEISLKLPQKSYQNLSMIIRVKDIFGFAFIVVYAKICYMLHLDILRKILTVYIYIYIFRELTICCT